MEDQARELRRLSAPGMLWVECVCCEKLMGTYPCDPESEGLVIVRTCPACLLAQRTPPSGASHADVSQYKS